MEKVSIENLSSKWLSYFW